MPRTLLLACATALASAGCAATVHGTVFADRNGNGVRDSNEPGVAGVVVAVDRTGFVTTDHDGHFTVDTSTPGSIVWARAPAAYRPGPVWTRADNPAAELPLVPLSDAEVASPLRFVVAADSHTTANPADPWDGGDLVDAIDQATSLPDPPRFFTIVGDVTQGGTNDEISRVSDALATTSVPWVPVPGNHDWIDGGKAYRTKWGPDNYSFDVGDLHVIVWDTNLSEDEQVAFVAADLAHVSKDMTVVGLAHASPTDDVADRIAALGVEYLFTGHWHANRRVPRKGLVEWGTQTFVMGGIDQSPAGYRIVTFEDGMPTIEHRERLVMGQLASVFPHAGSCAPASGFTLLAAAALDATTPTVTARIDCGPEIPLTAAGGWDYRADAPALPAGTHALELHAVTPAGRTLTSRISFTVCAPPAGPTAGDWPQVGAGPDHEGVSATAVAPPLQAAWTTAVGGSLVLGTPVISGATVVVAHADRAAGDHGGLVALDLATGAIRWQVTTPYPVTAAPAIDGDTVVATLASGEVRGYALADGTPRWQQAIAVGVPSLAASLWAPPTISNGVVFAGVEGRFSALDVATGAVLWSVDLQPQYPWLGSLAAPAIANDLVLASFGREDGITAFSTAAGDKRWQLKSALAVNAAPVVVGDVVYVATATGEVLSLDAPTGTVRWQRSLVSGGFDWAYAITAAPAYADGRLFVPTQWGALIALDATTGNELWRTSTPGGPLETAHYRSAQPGFAASPVVTGTTVWVGRPDGVLEALSVTDGHELWTTQLGSPMISTPAPAGSALVVATYDGTVHALVPGTQGVLAPPAACPMLAVARTGEGATPAGCCHVGGDPQHGPIVLAILLLLRRRRRYSAAPTEMLPPG